MTGQGRQGLIILSSGAKVQDGRQAKGQDRQRLVIQIRGKGTGRQALSESGQARVKTRSTRKRETEEKQELRQNAG
jgi:hypothetical protein